VGESRKDKLTPFMVMDVLARAREMEGVIHLEIGEPDIAPPPEVLEALKSAAEDGKYFYTPSLGLLELRERVARFYDERYGLSVSPERVIITTGTSGAFLVAYAITMDAGDFVALADPSYPCYRNFAHLLNIKPQPVPVSAESSYQIRADMLKNMKIKALHISSPSNPTGTLYSGEVLKELAEWCDRQGIYLISDEIYHGLVYEGEEHTALEFSERAIVINGFSKYFCMPGFRIGWMILPEELVRYAEIVVQNVFISAPTLSQYAAIKAFDYNYLEKVKETFRRRRDLLYGGVKDLFKIKAKPVGAFYIWADVSEYAQDSYEFSLRLLEEAGVAVTPGRDFGENETHHHIRLSYTRSEEELKEGVERLRDFLNRL